jgi:Ion transport protein
MKKSSSSTLFEDTSTKSGKNGGTTTLTSSVSFSERLNGIIPSTAASSGGATPSVTGSSSTNVVRPGMERMATKHNLNHAAVFTNIRAASETERLKNKELHNIETPQYILYPWNPYYKLWWGMTSAAAVATIFNEPFGIAFTPAGSLNAPTSIIEYILLVIFILDIVLHLNTAFYDTEDRVITHRKEIARHYVRHGTFLYDFLGVFPFYAIALAIAGNVGSDSKQSLYLSLFRLTRMVRLYRVKQLFDILSYSSKISLLSLTLIRNLGFAVAWSHFGACTMYFISRLYTDPLNTWIGDTTDQTNITLYLTSMYWSVVTFATVR